MFIYLAVCQDKSESCPGWAEQGSGLLTSPFVKSSVIQRKIASSVRISVRTEVLGLLHISVNISVKISAIIPRKLTEGTYLPLHPRCRLGYGWFRSVFRPGKASTRFPRAPRNVGRFQWCGSGAEVPPVTEGHTYRNWRLSAVPVGQQNWAVKSVDTPFAGTNQCLSRY